MFVFSKSLKRFKVSFQSVVQLTFVYDYIMKRLQKCTFKVVNQIEPMYSVHKIKLYYYLKTDNFEAQQKKIALDVEINMFQIVFSRAVPSSYLVAEYVYQYLWIFLI